MTGILLCTASANAQTFDFQKARASAPSNLMPVLPSEDLVESPDNKISNDIANKIYDRCLSKVPPRFTPDAHQYYCGCASTATQATIKMKELRELQSQKNWKLGNKTFEKYIHNVVAQCIDMPVEDMEYMNCILYRGTDWRIDRIPQYCKCVSNGARKYVKDFGEADLMIEWGDTKRTYESPLDALWYSRGYNNKKREVSENCIGNYMRYDPTRGGGNR